MQENTSVSLTHSSEMNYHFIIQTTQENGLNNPSSFHHSKLEKVDFHGLGASITQATHMASNPLEASQVKSNHMEADIFFFFGLFCLFSVFFSLYYVIFAPNKH